MSRIYKSVQSLKMRAKKVGEEQNFTNFRLKKSSEEDDQQFDEWKKVEKFKKSRTG